MTQASLLNYFTKFSAITSQNEPATKAQSSLLEKTFLKQLETGTVEPLPDTTIGNKQEDDESEQHASLILRRTTICPSHHPLTAIIPVQEDHIPALKRLTTVTLPVRYADKFFSMATTDYYAAGLSRVALYDSQPVGWIRCRIDPDPESLQPQNNAQPGIRQIYIQALCLLAPYRQCGLATRLLENIVNSSVAQECNVASIYAHVWEENEDALLWYEKRGFRRILLVENYYRRLKPSGAWIVRREISHHDSCDNSR